MAKPYQVILEEIKELQELSMELKEKTARLQEKNERLQQGASRQDHDNPNRMARKVVLVIPGESISLQKIDLLCPILFLFLIINTLIHSSRRGIIYSSYQSIKDPFSLENDYQVAKHQTSDVISMIEHTKMEHEYNVERQVMYIRDRMTGFNKSLHEVVKLKSETANQFKYLLEPKVIKVNESLILFDPESNFKKCAWISENEYLRVRQNISKSLELLTKFEKELTEQYRELSNISNIIILDFEQKKMILEQTSNF